MHVRYDKRPKLEIGLEPAVIRWMKRHTIQDLDIMAEKMERRGEDVSDLRGLIADLHVMEGKE